MTKPLTVESIEATMNTGDTITQDGQPDRVIVGLSSDPDPMQTGITALRQAGLDPLRLWSLKAPKDAGGTVSAVFLQATSEVAILHQLASGRFVVFEKSSVSAISGDDVPALGEG